MTDAREIAPTDSGIEELDEICRQYNNRDIDLCKLVCRLWNGQQAEIESHLAAVAAKDAELERRGKILSDAETELYAYGYEDGALVSESVKDLCVKALSLQKQVNQQAAEIERLTSDRSAMNKFILEQDKQIEQLQAIVSMYIQDTGYKYDDEAITRYKINHPGG